MDNYYHDDQIIKGFRDYRKDNSRPPSLHKTYYVVLRVKVGNAVWYHHTVLAIDESLHNHLESMKDALRASLNRPQAKISCVFVRNLITQEPSVLSAEVKLHSTNDLNAKLLNGVIFGDVAEQFLVFGFDWSDDSIVCVTVPSDDALDAGNEAIHAFKAQMKIDLHPYDIIAVSPAIPEIISLFEKRAPQLLEHVRSSWRVGK